jgi:hypothetical protein
MQTGIFGTPVIENLSQTAHDYYHGFLIVDGKLMNQAELSRKLPTLINDTTLTFVAIQDSKGLFEKLEWAEEMSGSQIQSKLDGDNSLVAFTVELQHSDKLTSSSEQFGSILSGLFGSNTFYSSSKANDRVNFELNTKKSCFMLNITKDA